MTSFECNVCGRSGQSLAREEARVRSNVRAFREELFAVWRCGGCGSLHAKDEVDLAHYYARYPFHALPDDWRMRAMLDNFVRRLRAGGVGPEDRVLDYGCGGGGLLEHLARRGFSHTAGFDEYSDTYGDRAVLGHQYDCVVSQDVIEHVPSPLEFLEQMTSLVRPGGTVIIGTPNASALRLDHAERYVHALHLPYHRHILSKEALIEAAERRGLKLLRYYPTQYSNTLVPFLNSRFYRYYLDITDDTLDVLTEAVRVGPLLLRAPLTLFWGLFGYFLAEETDVMAVFQREG
jgi:2-polyprenyl-3-methyl-5-hydroxy-6-metoxy-1,4-benzoquinol methylase